MSKYEVVIKENGVEITRKECDAYLLATKNQTDNFMCAVHFESYKNMCNLVTTCIAIMIRNLQAGGNSLEYIDKCLEYVANNAYEATLIDWDNLNQDKLI